MSLRQACRFRSGNQYITQLPTRLGYRMAVAVVTLLAHSTPARADATVYVGTLMSGGPRAVIGVSVGAFPPATGSIIGFELDYFGTRGDSTPGRSAISVLGGGLLVQSNVISRRLQIYGAGGLGLYGETTSEGRGSGEVAAVHIGSGLKITLAGPLKVRIDYRLFFLDDAANSSLGRVHRHPQRLSAGLSLAF